MTGRRGRILQNIGASMREQPGARREDLLNPPAAPVVSSPAISQDQPPVVSPQDIRQEQPPVASETGASTSAETVARSRRGRLLNQFSSLSISREQTAQQEQSPPPRPEQPNRGSSGSTDGSNSGPGRLSRSGSNVSRSSVISQQFAEPQQTGPRPLLPKDPSTAGSQIKLHLNYTAVETTDGKQILEYHVDFSPNIESMQLRYALLRTSTVKEVIGQVMHWNGTNLYLPIQLARKVTEVTEKHPVTGVSVTIKLTLVRCPRGSELVSFYNSLMHKVMTRLRYVIINRQHFSPLHKISIQQHKLEVWPGWITAIQELDGGLKLVVDASFKVLRLETVYDLLVHIKDRQRGSNLREAFESALVGTIIMTKYNNKAYRIDGIELTKKPTDTFMLSRGDDRQITYIDYMKEHWNVDITVPNQPMIVHKPKPKRGQPDTGELIYLVPELCVTTGITDEMRANHLIMRDIIASTRVAPDIRETKLNEFLNQISTDERAKSVFSDWNLSIRPSVEVVAGRRLESESILTTGGRELRVPENVDWTRPVTSQGVYKSVDIDSWVFIHLDRDSGVANDFLRTLRDVAQQLRIKFCPPRVIQVTDDSARTYVATCKREVKLTDQMVVLLTPGRAQRLDRYSACKRLLSTELPVPCQFIRCGSIDNERKIRSVVQKIVIQILSKVGGQPWAMKFPMKNFMVVGIDVYHDTIDRKKSCVGVVASMNETTSQWWSRTCFQQSLEEISMKLHQSIVEAVKKYHRLNNAVPQKIIVYRDGVGDGQLEVVQKVEVAQIMQAIDFYMRDNHAEEPIPSISYVIVQKRINAKMILNERGSIRNPLPGSYLDHTITHPDYNDFYLVSQHVNQGTVSPTKYIVLAETGTLKMQHHQKLAYKMTHMYFNWCGTIRVPAPCQYAHKLAYLTGENIKLQANERLDDKLYYL